MRNKLFRKNLALTQKKTLPKDKAKSRYHFQHHYNNNINGQQKKNERIQNQNVVGIKQTNERKRILCQNNDQRNFISKKMKHQNSYYSYFCLPSNTLYIYSVIIIIARVMIRVYMFLTLSLYRKIITESDSNFTRNRQRNN